MFLESLKITPKNEIELLHMMIEKVTIIKDNSSTFDIKIKYKFEI